MSLLTSKNMITTILVHGMHCPACKVLIEDVCKDTQGVASCSVDFQTGKTIIEHDPNMDMSALKSALEQLGEYKVENV